MGRKALIAVVAALAVILALGVSLIALLELGHFSAQPTEVTTVPTQPADTTLPSTTASPTTEPTTVSTTEAPTVPTTEPQPEYFTLTFVGDCTLGSTPSSMGNSGSFIQVVGEDYEYPFRNVMEYFAADDCTFVNLEGVFADDGTAADKLFTFRAPLSYGKILTAGSVEAVTIANNHTYDFGAEGYHSTKGVLDGLRVHYAEQNGSVIFSTKSGLRIGMYAISFEMDKEDMAAEIAGLREKGAELIVVALHSGTEGAYRPTGKQTNYAHACIDAGADIVWGHHPHVLQKIEEYNGGIIYYSLGNFSFGGNRNPSDKDSAILQQEIVREPDGTVRLGELTIIPCSITSASGINNYQPTPLEPDTKAYDRVLSKLDGTYTGPDIIPSYNKPEQTQPGAEPATEPSSETTTAP